MKHIVILGGGFAGVAAAKKLLNANIPDTKIILVDRNSYHTFTPSLYELATSEEPAKNVGIPLSEIFPKKIMHIKGEVKKIEAEKKRVILSEDRIVDFDYLLFALGSQSANFGIEGLAEYGMPLKTIADAVAIRNRIKSSCCENGKCHRKVQLIIGGGGFSGTELAAEMLMYKKRLARQNNLDSDCLEVSIIQGSDRLLNELDPHVSTIATKRIAGKSVKFCFGGHIKEVTKSWIATDDDKKYEYDIFVWTGGVAPSHVTKNSDLPLTPHGQIMVNRYLQVEAFPYVFVAGDTAGYVDPSGKPVPGVAQVAEDEGAIAGLNIAQVLQGKELMPYHYRHFGYIVPLKGRFAAAEIEGIHMDGFFAWVLQQLVFLKYLLSILPFWKALNKWDTFEMSLSQ